MIAAIALGTTTISAQWLRYPTPGIPRSRDGKPDLSVRAPRMSDGKPDFSGVWLNDGYNPANVEGVGAPPRTVFFDLAHGLAGGRHINHGRRSWQSSERRTTRRTIRMRGACRSGVTIDDPGAYTKPWTVNLNQHIAVDTDLLEYACLENEKDVPPLGRQVAPISS